MWGHIHEEILRKSYLKYGISNKMDETKDDNLSEDFLDESVTATEDVADRGHLRGLAVVCWTTDHYHRVRILALA